MLYALGILLFVVAIMVSVGLHEGGHMAVARLLKMIVPRYFVGFGPTLFSRTYKGTEYGVKAIPAGGFVEIEPAPEDDPHVNKNLPDSSDGKTRYSSEKLKADRDFRKGTLAHVAPWKRILVYLAGPAVNIVLGTVLLVMAFWIAPVITPQPTIDQVKSCSQSSVCAAEEAGFEKGDRIVAVDGVDTPTTNDISEALKPNEELTVTVIRDGSSQDVKVKTDADGQIGINFTIAESSRTFVEAVEHTGHVFMISVEALSELPERFMNTASILWGEDRTDETLGSVVSAGNTFGVTTSSPLLELKMKATTLLAYTGAFNLSIGLLNLLPLMPLDGGKIAIALVDAVRNGVRRARKLKPLPLNSRVVQAVSGATVAIVFVGFAVIILADIISPAGA